MHPPSGKSKAAPTASDTKSGREREILDSDRVGSSNRKKRGFGVESPLSPSVSLSVSLPISLSLALLVVSLHPSLHPSLPGDGHGKTFSQLGKSMYVGPDFSFGRQPSGYRPGRLQYAWVGRTYRECRCAVGDCRPRPASTPTDTSTRYNTAVGPFGSGANSVAPKDSNILMCCDGT